jgi:hypothetical protein
MFNCLILEIPHISRGEKAKHHYCLRKESTNTTMRDLKGSCKGISEFYFKNLAKLQKEG